ncbi:N-formylglutamate deformylase [Ramlibacter sp.]|uniref:N-formylglutamate deformylase n=1 Tax=Ramlibacter sp. TaxID=1917967 RepID=UPI0035B1AA51
MTADPLFAVRRGQAPLLISIPHLGTRIPDDLKDVYTDDALLLADTDWHLDRLYAFARQLDATVVQANVSRYVIDLNRPASGESLYPGMVTTSLCPSETFRGQALYRSGMEPDSAEVARRVQVFWRPYHAALQHELTRLRKEHAHVLLWEAHSIASLLPRLFAGKLPDLNFGTSDGESCHERVIAGALKPARTSPFTWVLNGRFKGGFITRKYGTPADGVHAVQLEMCQSVYMDEHPPFGWREDLAKGASDTVRACIEGALEGLLLLPASDKSRHADILAG